MNAAVHTPLSAEVILRMPGAPVRRLVSDSHRVTSGDTFAAYPGEKLDGRDFIDAAIANGAASILWEAGDERHFRWRNDWRVAHLPVHCLKHRLGELADLVYGRPSQALWMAWKAQPVVAAL